MTQFVADLPCQISLPEPGAGGASAGSASPYQAGDRRRFARRAVVGAAVKAGLEYRQTLPAVDRQPAWHAVYVVEVSRGGLRILHFENLYPGESFRVLLPDGVCRDVVVTWCRRVNARCYTVGVRFSDLRRSASSVATEQ